MDNRAEIIWDSGRAVPEVNVISGGYQPIRPESMGLAITRQLAA